MSHSPTLPLSTPSVGTQHRNRYQNTQKTKKNCFKNLLPVLIFPSPCPAAREGSGEAELELCPQTSVLQSSPGNLLAPAKLLVVLEEPLAALPRQTDHSNIASATGKFGKHCEKLYRT